MTLRTDSPAHVIQDHYDVVVIGGAFAGASAALLLRRWLPNCRIAVIERQQCFTRKVGEATVEVSGLFLYRVLGLYDHLSREQLFKQGLRYWFTDGPDRKLSEMSEIGIRSMPTFPTFQLDRSRLDEHLLATAQTEGCQIWRPARVLSIAHDWPRSQIIFADSQGEHQITARWIIDASGRQAFIARRLGLQRRVEEHPTAAVWARWENVTDLDGPEVMGSDPRHPELHQVQASRRLATNHFCGYGWWCWVIPLAGGQTSIGVVYNKKLFDIPGSGKLRERYRDFLMTQPGLRELVASATMVLDDFFALGQLPYKTSRYLDRGWALVGDAASFMDPYYSPGLDHAAISVYATASLIEEDLKGGLDEEALSQRIETHNDRFLRSYDRWIATLYQDKYELLGDAELVRCAYLVDTSLYHLFVVSAVYKDLNQLRHPVLGLPLPQATLVYRLMRFFNRRLVKLARFRRRVGRYGRRNIGWHSYGSPFGLNQAALKPLCRGLGLWLKLELEYRGYRLRKGSIEISQPVPDKATLTSSSPVRSPFQ